MSLKKKKKILAELNDEDSTGQPSNVSSNDLNNESVETTEIPMDGLRIIFIPDSQQEKFECVVGKHVFIDKPWAKISHKKIIDDLQLKKSNSCFWQLKETLEGIKNKNVLVGYKPFSNTNEEFLICTTDKTIQYIEETYVRMEHELQQKVERSILRVPGPWESKSSENDIEDIRSVQTRDKITYKWKIPSGRLQAKAEFEDSNSKSVYNECVKLEPRLNEILESSEFSVMESSVQAVRKMINREMQTTPRIKNNKCIQSVAVEEEMFQLLPLTNKSNKALDDFLEKHVPNLVNHLQYNELYDLYRGDYTLSNNENEKPNEENLKVIKLHPEYQLSESQKRYTSCQTWHPTIPGVFAVSYSISSNTLYKSVCLEIHDKEIAKSTVRDEKYSNFLSGVQNDQESCNNQQETKLVIDEYKEKIMSLLNKEFDQRMRKIQLTEDEKTNEKDSYEQDINGQHNSFTYISHEQPSTANSDLETLIHKNCITDETKSGLMDIDAFKNIYHRDELSMDYDSFIEKNDYGIEKKTNKKMKNSMKIMSNVDMDVDENKYQIDHHDSDTESFYNIWGDDDDWLYGNELRNIVRNNHRNFNKKYDREAREEKLFSFLKSENKCLEKKNRAEDMKTENLKLAKDMFEAADIYQTIKSQQKLKSKKRIKPSSEENKQYNNNTKHESGENYSNIQEIPPVVNNQNNSVIIWSIGDIFPKLILESPEEVHCVEFNPRNGNTVVGGLINGQICIWDIKGKLETINTNDLNVSKKEKNHHRYLWNQMKWSFDVDFKNRIKPAALSGILESHESTVTAIQWIHPMNEVTPFGKLVTTQEGQFSNQFFSASMDGTIKIWDLHSTPLPKTKQKNTMTCFGLSENLNNYKAPLSIYNNRLKPTYTIQILDPEKATSIPITALSFEIPLMQYKCICNQPLVIGKRQFEYVPTTPHNPNRILVVGNVIGQIGVVTWNGYDKHKQGQDVEECKHIWWGHVHDGPINCIKRNVFYPDIHLVCGGHVVSIWSLNYKAGPVWWKRFSDFINSVLWSTIHPAEFRVSFSTSGVLQFWNFIKSTYEPCNTFDFFSNDGLIAMLSAPYPSIHFIGAERLKFADGINEVMDCEKNELISFSDSTGAIIMITNIAATLGPNEIEEVRRVFYREVDLRKELDAWNEKYIKKFVSIEEKNDYKSSKLLQTSDISRKIEDVQPVLMQEKNIKRMICDETFKWYFNRRGPQTRLVKLREKYIDREKRYTIETMMKKKNVNQNQLEEYFKKIVGIKNDEYNITKIRLEADESYRDIVNKLLAVDHTEECVINIDSKKSILSNEMKNSFEKIHHLLVTNIITEKEKLCNYIKNNPYKLEQEKWGQIIEFAEQEIRDRLNDQTLLKSPALRLTRRKLAKKYTDEGYRIKEWKSRKHEHACDLYKIRESKINQLKSMYGQSYDPYWDKGLRPQKMKDAIRIRSTETGVENYEQLYNYEEGGENCYEDNMSLSPSYIDQSIR